MRDPVLDREMFRNPSDVESGGIPSIPKSPSSYEERKRRAEELIALAKERQNPENFKTLAEQSRPGVFRPVATGQPQAPQPNVQQQMAQMQAMGFRPAGMKDGGYVQHFANGGLGTLDRQGPRISLNPFSESFLGDYGIFEEERAPRRLRPETLPYASTGTPTPSPIPVKEPTKEPASTATEPAPETPKKTEKSSSGIGSLPPDIPPTKLEDIKASRQENIALAMIQAGLAMAGGESPNALKNIAAGGISGLGAYSQLEKERRAAETEERRYGEEKQARIQRSQELRQEKDLTREARVYDTAQSNLTAIDREISRLQAEMGKAMGDETQLAPIRTRIQELLEDRKRVGSVVNRSLRNLGYEGEDIFSAGSSTPVTPAIDFSKLPK